MPLFLVFSSLFAAPIAAAQPSLDALPPATAPPPLDALPPATAPPPLDALPPATAPPPLSTAAPVTAQPSLPLGPAETVDPPASSGGREAMWRLELGYRASFVPNAGYDAFSTNDLLPQFSVAATRSLFAGRRASFAMGLSWDIGSSSATDRGDRAKISAQRLTAPLEGRAHFGVWGYAFVRGAPGVVAQHTEVDDPSAPGPLSKTRWLFATDLSAGYAWLAWPRTRQPSQGPSLWLQADGGYGWVARERLDLGPALASGDARIVSGIDLGTLSLSGPFFRVAAAASF